jgi:arylsulfatase
MIEYRYDTPFKFTGKITKLRFELGPSEYTALEKQKATEAMARARD